MTSYIPYVLTKSTLFILIFIFLLNRTQEFLNLVVQDMFASLDFEGKMELVKR